MLTEADFPPDVVQDQLDQRFVIAPPPIGAGAQGLVYAATRVQTRAGAAVSEPTALKLYDDAVELERIEREIQLLESTRHPCLAQILEHGRISIGSKNVRYVAWEFIDGESADQVIGRGALSARAVAVIGRDVSRAVAEIWSQTVVHRDIKPGNIMLRASGDGAVLIDLGVARHLSRASLTGSGATWGTRGYMSPEQTRAERRLTCKSDLFSLGITLQEALLGRHPTGYDQNAIVTSPPATAVLVPAAPGALCSQIDKLLSLRAAFRPEPTEAAESFARLLSIL